MSFLTMSALGVSRNEQYQQMMARVEALRKSGAASKFPDEFSLLEDALNYPANRDSLTALQNIEKQNLEPLERKLSALPVKPGGTMPNGNITPPPPPSVNKWILLAVAGFVVGGLLAMILSKRRN